MTRYDILPPEQRALLDALRPAAALGQVLYGGTAIALQLGHRESIDFDFFSERPLDEPTLTEAMPFLEVATTLQRAPDTWTVQTGDANGARPIKLSFFGGLRFGRVGAPHRSDDGELLIATLDDLFGHKLKVLLQRVEAKDYRDIAAILRTGLRIERGLGAASALFGPSFPPADALRAMTWFDGGDLERLPAADRATLAAAAASAGAAEFVPILSESLSA